MTYNKGPLFPLQEIPHLLPVPWAMPPRVISTETSVQWATTVPTGLQYRAPVLQVGDQPGGETSIGGLSASSPWKQISGGWDGGTCTHLT